MKKLKPVHGMMRTGAEGGVERRLVEAKPIEGVAGALGTGRSATREFNRVFGIGLSKTGTTTLDGALNMLGLRSVHYPSPDRMAALDFAFLDELDAATDISITAYYPQLDARYPGSRFVLTTRAVEPWLASVERHFAARDQRKYEGNSGAGIVRERCYGRRDFERASFIEAYHRHEESVRAYFRGRERDLLVMGICDGEGWEALCPFLGMEEPRAAFPHLHKQRTAAVVSG